MDPLSIVGTAVSLTVAIGSVAHEVDQFTRQVREARRELNDISRELGSLKSAIELLSEDLKTPGVLVPGSLADILQECQDSITRLNETIQKYAQEKLTTRIRYVWAGKETIMMHKGTLSAHRAALDLAVDVITLSLSREIKAGVDETLENTKEIKTGVDETRANTDRILEQIAALQARLPEALQNQRQMLGTDSAFMLQKYLDELTEYAETVIGGDVSDADEMTPRVSMETPRSSEPSPTTPGEVLRSVDKIPLTGQPRSLHSEGTQDTVALSINSEPQDCGYSDSDQLDAPNEVVSAQEQQHLPNQLASGTVWSSTSGSHAGPRSLKNNLGLMGQGLESGAKRPPAQSMPKEEVHSLVINPEREQFIPTQQPHSREAITSIGDSQPAPSSSSVPQKDDHAATDVQALSARLPRSALLRSVVTEFDMIAQREVSGFETLAHKTWRQDLQENMKQILDRDVAPAKGEVYQAGVDYDVDTNVDKALRPQVRRMGRVTITEAKRTGAFYVKWARALTMQNPLVCGSILLPTYVIFRSRELIPLVLAMELHDWDWMDHLLHAGNNKVGATHNGHVGPHSHFAPTGMLSVALDWNIALAEKILEWWTELDARTAEPARWDALAYILPHQNADLRIAPKHLKSLAALRLLALEKFLKQRGELDRSWLFRRRELMSSAIARSDTHMVDALLRHAQGHGLDDRGDSLHMAIIKKNWNMVRHLADLGADLEYVAKVRGYELNSESKKGLSAVELAAALGCLDKYNEAVGKNFKDKRPMLSRMSSAISWR